MFAISVSHDHRFRTACRLYDLHIFVVGKKRVLLADFIT